MASISKINIKGSLHDIKDAEARKYILHPIPKTDDMTQPVGVDANGVLFTKPESGGSADLSKLDLSLSGTTLKVSNNGTQQGTGITIPTASQADINTGIASYMAEHPVSAIVGDGSVSMVKLDSQVKNILTKDLVVYDYMTAVTQLLNYGTKINIFGTEISENKIVTVTIKPTAGTGDITVYFYQKIGNTYTKYHSKTFSGIDNANAQMCIADKVTLPNTYIGIKTARYTLYDSAPASADLVGSYYVNPNSDIDNPTLLTTPSMNYLGKIVVTDYVDKISNVANEKANNNKANIDILKSGRGSVLYVGVDNNFKYNTISSAVNDAQSGDTIVIYPGTYLESALGASKKLHFIGINRDACIVYNPYAEKQMSVFDLVGGSSVKNLTILQTHEQPSSMVETVAYKAYCVHMDRQKMAGETTIVENCILKNKYMACVGIGLWQDSEVIVKDCNMYVYDINPIERNRNSGALFCHANSSSPVTGQKIKVINCYMRSTANNAIKIDSTSQTGNEMTIELIGNTCISDALGITSVASIGTSAQTTKMLTCHGNNIPAMNYS